METVIIACAAYQSISVGGHTIRGTAYERITDDHGRVLPPPYERVRGVKRATFAITRNFPKDVWDEWYKNVGRHLDITRNGQLFAHEQWHELLTLCHNALPVAQGHQNGVPRP